MVPQGPPQALPPLARRSIATRHTILIVVVVIAVVIVLAIAAVFAFFNEFASPRTPEGEVLGWLFSAGFGDATATADRTIARVIGGQVYTDTKDWYHSLFETYRGNTRVDVSNLVMLSNSSLSLSMILSAQAAVVLLELQYGITVEEYRYASFQFTGFGFDNAQKTVGVLKVGSDWRIGYATGVVDLGNI